MPILVSNHINYLEKNLAKFKFVQDNFPDAKYHYLQGFSSKTVNSKYTDWTFEDSRGLYILPYFKLNFEYNGQTEIIKIHSSPRRNRLAYYSYSRLEKKLVMKFSRFIINFKKNNFKEDMYNDCRAEILKFIKDSKISILDKKHLEPRLQKLLLFT